MDTISKIILNIEKFINLLVPVIFAIAFIVFIWGIFTYFIAGGANDEQRQKGRQLAFWGIVGFAIMVSVWGLINLVTNSLGLSGQARPCLPTFGACSKATTNDSAPYGTGGFGVQN